MNGWYIVLIGIISLFIIIWFTVIHIRLEYNRVEENDELLVEFTTWRFIRYKKMIPLLDLNNEGVQYKEKSKTETGGSVQTEKKGKGLFTPQDFYNLKRKIDWWLRRVHDLNKIMKKTFKRVGCDQLEWNTKIGLGEAAATGTFTGVVWSIQSCIVAVIAHYISLRSMPKMNVLPNFHNKLLETHLLLRLRFRVGSGLIAILQIYMNFIRKVRKGKGI